MLQFGARVVDAELPVDPGLFTIAHLGPGRRFRRDQSPALDPAIHVLAVQRIELQFRDVQPAPAFRRVAPSGCGRSADCLRPPGSLRRRNVAGNLNLRMDMRML